MQFREKFGQEVKRTIRDWDSKHPIDYLWRKAFKIPYGSPEHLAASFIDQQMWYEEQVLIKEVLGQSGSGTAKGTASTYHETGIDQRGMNEQDIAEIEAKYTGEDATEKLQALITKQTEQWQKASTEQ